MFRTLFEWVIDKLWCKHNFVVDATPYIDNSHGLRLESVRYHACCQYCGKQHVRFVYGGRFTEAQIKVMCDNNKPPGRKMP